MANKRRAQPLALLLGGAHRAPTYRAARLALVWSAMREISPLYTVHHKLVSCPIRAVGWLF